MSYTVRLRLNEILAEQKKTRKQLAHQAGLRPSTVSTLCNQPVQRIYLRTLASLCETLDVSISDLLVLEKH
ncbi:helix-turn-helix transcriptional regulator [Aneurinibacillus thermoaerophilus]|uniref:Helix-turn-helix transcriptional regulator n=1 Tax=Aneurinibacillus thermoaerophilus TaxID=143495 RepID=A0ABX8YE18_ANETH|nr:MULTISPECIES: helix-turn-helix transcriptional regulator [Aneurinibacillus]AMA73473.1 transcriptional regulator [Aneurinibacillus sp. XH2]MED0759088.1 helix-turn-helix transcriptional regulator [Aneurinibacillus thermoaerophilus]MED0762157.1 helix-turn-helix transcriptional regulator [Aneurinibacillus thermoaerophilus]QYY43952.1 helix-turn-helix transcriptional regulator [Aneurinibacillus thermoaerophilus]